LKDLVKTKAKGEVQVVRQAMKKPRQTQDLIAALKASLARPAATKNTKES
jgi:DNA end-binding protein Ku